MIERGKEREDRETEGEREMISDRGERRQR